jgi:FixJ family two-component response regulator
VAGKPATFEKHVWVSRHIVNLYPSSVPIGASREFPSSFVYVIDDHEMMRDALASLFASAGLQAQTFATSHAFLAYARPPMPSCLVLDVRLRGESGLTLQQEFAARRFHIPIVFMTGHGDIAMCVEAMKGGAIDFLTKPFRDQDMLDAVTRALYEDGKRLASERNAQSVRRSFGTLTPREQQVLRYVVQGMLNKQIAAQLAVSEITIKIHRGNMMRKMAAKSVVDLMHKVEFLGDYLT